MLDQQYMPGQLSQQMGDLLSVDDLTVCYARSPIPAVRELSFRIRNGERVGIVGESGSGKTTLALAVSGLLPSEASISRGSVILNGIDYSGLTRRALRNIRGGVIGRVPQDPLAGLNPVLTVRTQLRDAIRAHRRLPKGAERQEITHVLQSVAIPDIETKLRLYPHELSGGMRQRVLIAMALINHPALLVADEPTTALDATIQAQILSIIRQACLQRNMALILVSHNINVVATVCQRIIVMYRGEVVEDAPTHSIYHSPLHPYTKVLIEASKSDRGARVQGDPAGGERSTGCPYRLSCPHPLSQCGTQHPLLEQIAAEQHVRCFAVAHAATWMDGGASSHLVGHGAGPRNEGSVALADVPRDARLAAGRDRPTPAQEVPVLVAKDLVKLYKPRGRSTRQLLRAVDGVSLDCWAGDTIGIVGESGCGKTTLGQMLSGLIQPTSGSVSVSPAGHGERAAAPTRPGTVQMVFQDPAQSLDPRVSIAASVKEPILNRNGPSVSERVNAALANVGLDGKLGTQLPHQLSGGQQQRACIARDDRQPLRRCPR